MAQYCPPRTQRSVASSSASPSISESELNSPLSNVSDPSTAAAAVEEENLEILLDPGRSIFIFPSPPSSLSGPSTDGAGSLDLSWASGSRISIEIRREGLGRRSGSDGDGEWSLLDRGTQTQTRILDTLGPGQLARRPLPRFNQYTPTSSSSSRRRSRRRSRTQSDLTFTTTPASSSLVEEFNFPLDVPAPQSRLGLVKIPLLSFIAYLLSIDDATMNLLTRPPTHSTLYPVPTPLSPSSLHADIENSDLERGHGLYKLFEFGNEERRSSSLRKGLLAFALDLDPEPLMEEEVSLGFLAL